MLEPRLGIHTQLVNKRERYVIKDKKVYNAYNCVMVDSLTQVLGTTCYKVLLLDHLDLGTTTALYDFANVPLTAMDIVSSSVLFKVNDQKKHGLRHTGELSEFVDIYGETRVYDAFILDFCCVWKESIAELVDRMLGKKMLKNMAIVSFTFSGRLKTNIFKGNKISARDGLYDLFRKNGYHLQWWFEHEEGTMFSLYGKCIYTKEALSYSNAKKMDASRWLMTHPQHHQEEIEKKKKMRSDNWTCRRGHELDFLVGSRGRKKTSCQWSCDNCKCIFTDQKSRYHCDTCIYDLCENCK